MAQLMTIIALVLLAALIKSSHAEPATTTTSTTNSFPTILDPDDPGTSIGTSTPGAVAGADGADGGFKLSTGAIIGICVAIALIIVAFITLWALWFTAKRRNWAVRDTLKYASRRLTGRGAVPPTPRTPHTPHPARGAARGRAGPTGNRGVTMYTASRQQNKDDVERGGALAMSQKRDGSMKPKAGWLAQEEEKQSSRSLTPSSRGGRQ